MAYGAKETFFKLKLNKLTKSLFCIRSSLTVRMIFDFSYYLNQKSTNYLNSKELLSDTKHSTYSYLIKLKY